MSTHQWQIDVSHSKGLTKADRLKAQGRALWLGSECVLGEDTLSSGKEMFTESSQCFSKHTETLILCLKAAHHLSLVTDIILG